MDGTARWRSRPPSQRGLLFRLERDEVGAALLEDIEGELQADFEGLHHAERLLRIVLLLEGLVRLAQKLAITMPSTISISAGLEPSATQDSQRGGPFFDPGSMIFPDFCVQVVKRFPVARIPSDSSGPMSNASGRCYSTVPYTQ